MLGREGVSGGTKEVSWGQEVEGVEETQRRNLEREARKETTKMSQLRFFNISSL